MKSKRPGSGTITGRTPATPRTHPPGRAFSLIEVTIALGVVSFALVSITGMLPIGLTHFKKAIDTTIESQIVQGLASQVELADFSALNPGASGSTSITQQQFAYDYEGNTLPSVSDPRALYLAKVGVVQVSGSNSPANIPAQAYNIQFSISNPNQNPPVYHVYSMVVANNGR